MAARHRHRAVATDASHSLPDLPHEEPMTSALVERDTDTTPAVEPLSLLQLAIDKGADPDKLGKLVDLAERMERAKAQRAFAVAMNELQTELPAVVKDAQNPHTKSPYARLETISDKVDPIILAHGFSMSYGSEPAAQAGTIRLYLDVTHRGGHSVRVHGEFPADKSGAMNPIQGVGSTYTYARRYLKCLAFDIQVRGMDNDGGGGQPISAEQLRIILDYLNDTKTDPKKFLRWAGVGAVEQMPAAKFDDAVAFFRSKQGGAK